MRFVENLEIISSYILAISIFASQSLKAHSNCIHIHIGFRLNSRYLCITLSIAIYVKNNNKCRITLNHRVFWGNIL